MSFSDAIGNSAFAVDGGSIVLAQNQYDDQKRKTGWWIEFLPLGDEKLGDSQDSEDPLVQADINTARSFRIEARKGEGMSEYPFVYYEKGLYLEGRRVGTWRLGRLSRKLEALYEYTEDGKKTGSYVDYQCDDLVKPTVSATGTYKNGIKDGPEYYVLKRIKNPEDDEDTDEDSKKLPKVEIRGVKYAASFVNNFKDGKIVSEGRADRVGEYEGKYDADGKRTGYWKDETGEGEYVAGVKQGKWKSTFNRWGSGKFSANNAYSAAPSEETNFVTFVDGVLNGPSYQNGDKGDYKDDKKEGFWKEVYQWSDKKVEKGMYKSGRRTGRWDTQEGFRTYVDGVLTGPCVCDKEGERKEGEYLNDLAVGEWKVYDSNKKVPTLLRKVTYADGVLNGPCEHYFNGYTVKGQYADTRPVGEWTHSHRPEKVVCGPNARFSVEIREPWIQYQYMRDDTTEARLMSQYRKDGTLTCGTDEKGELHGDMTQGQNKHPRIRGHYEHGIRTGHWVYYYDTFEGAPKQAEGDYVNDRRNGEWTIYDINNPSKVLMKGQYRNGKMIGTWVSPAHGVEIVFP
jgi:hypothetical protein